MKSKLPPNFHKWSTCFIPDNYQKTHKFTTFNTFLLKHWIFEITILSNIFPFDPIITEQFHKHK